MKNWKMNEGQIEQCKIKKWKNSKLRNERRPIWEMKKCKIKKWMKKAELKNEGMQKCKLGEIEKVQERRIEKKERMQNWRRMKAELKIEIETKKDHRK